MDIALSLANGIPALNLSNGDIATDSGLRSAVIASIFTDRQAYADDALPDNSTNRRGSWQDQYLDQVGDKQGSRLWLLNREKQLPSVLTRAETYAQEALQWLVDDAVATSITVTAQWLDSGWLALHIRIELPNDTPFEDVFNYPLEAV